MCVKFCFVLRDNIMKNHVKTTCQIFIRMNITLIHLDNVHLGKYTLVE